MKAQHITEITKDLNAKTVLVSRVFAAPLESIWNAFTSKHILDQWWGPDPWRAHTKQMDFAIGGTWIYAMIGPEGEKMWGRTNYTAIKLLKSFSIEDVFCDEEGNPNSSLPHAKGMFSFTEVEGGTKVEQLMHYETAEEITQIVEMGFEEGISICYKQLDKLFGHVCSCGKGK